MTAECEDFKAEETVDPDTQHKLKIATKNAYKSQMMVGIPISLLFVVVVIMSQFLLRYF